MNINKLASAIYNDVYSGLRGFHHNMSLSIPQLEDEIVEMRLLVLKEFQLKGILPYKDLLQSINCIPVDCRDLDKCPCNVDCHGEPVAHFEIPQLVTDFGRKSIYYIGSTDKQTSFNWYSSMPQQQKYSKYRKRQKDKPSVYIDMTPNENSMYDGYIFNAPLIQTLSIVGIFKDERQFEGYTCCNTDDDVPSIIDSEVKNRITNNKFRWYRQYQAPVKPNTQTHE